MRDTITRTELQAAIAAGSVTLVETLGAMYYSYTDVRKYAEGKQDWEAAGLPLEVPTHA
jgi:hypothetical protein